MKAKRELGFNDEQIIRYMGSKRNIIDHVVKAIMKIHNDKKIFCDLMSGTNSVGYAIKTLKNKNIGIISNDSQIYSFVIAKTLIENNKIKYIPVNEAKEDLIKNFDKNLSLIEEKWDNKYILKNQYRTSNSKNKTLDKQGVCCLFTFYFSKVFFSLKQCKEIDSLRYAIKNIKDKTKKNIYLTCLLYAVSYGSSSFGHFAQPRKITKEVLEIRKKPILNLFFKRLKNLKIGFNKCENICFNQDYKKLFLNKKFLQLSKNITTIYLDPPYSPANYSRFYHILETLIKYDYPKNEYKGLYRDKRFLSNFCKIKTVEYD